MDSRGFLRLREKALKSLEKAIQEEKVDEDIIDILNILNRNKDIFTTSSCSGRAVIIEVPYPGAKPGARFLGKWHRRVEKEDVYRSLESARNGFLMFMVHPPIIHAVVKDPLLGEKLVKAALSSGFKNSGMRGIKGKIVVELRSTERMDVLIGKDRKLLVDDEYIEVLCEMANLMLEKGKRKLHVLKEYLNRATFNN
ncbi:MAG TPA: hypothetical protein ENL44_01310 [Thermoplasmatales archaeon]|nr:MAG: hypothetical protein FE042_00060 [Thermoplasmata archaeon]KAA0018428.1 MAG: hypothetical protein FE037_00065 [Thermoplasmata archaeon]MCD6542534.1 hypothetical protein [Thermoplasmata archaeon]HHF58823.1 hypothetical protein [Thermoplasmatales archaeon]